MSAGASTLGHEQPGPSQPTPTSPNWPPIPGFKPRAEDALAHLLARTPAMRLVLGAGAASAVIYALFILAFPITVWWGQPHQVHNPNAINDMGYITHYSPLAAVAFVVAILLLFWCQFLVLNAISRREERPSRAVQGLAVAFPVVFAAILIWMQPVTTTDLYGYIARGYLYVHLHLNPMTSPAFLLPGDKFVTRPASPYGPAWLLICALFSLISGENLLLNMLLFKLTGVVCLVLAMWLLYVLAQRLHISRPERVVTFFAWNPLVLFEAIGNGHNDIVMMVCVLAALLLMLHRRARAAFALLVLGALVKYIAALLVPLWLVYELNQLRHRVDQRRLVAAPSGRATGGPGARRQPTRLAEQPAVLTRSAPTRASGTDGQHDSAPRNRGARAVASLTSSAREALLAINEVERRAALELIAGAFAIGLVLVVGFYMPFWQGIKTFAGVGQQLRPLYYNGSIVQFIVAPFELLVPPSNYAALDKTVRLLFYAIFGVYAWIQTHRLWIAGKRATIQDLITAGAKLVFAALILIAFWFQPWYVVWLLPLAALSDDSFVRSRAAILSGGSLLTYAVANYLFVHETGIGQALFVQFFEVLVAFLPLLLLQAAPTEHHWGAIARGYLGLLGEGLRRRSALWDRIMLALILVVAVLLRLVRLGNLFGAVSPNSASSNALGEISGDLRLILADPRGLQGPFNLLQRGLVMVFGLSPFAILLPSAIIGSLTVWLIYLVTTAILSDGSAIRARVTGLLAALLAATSNWHVSLSRSGVQVLVLPLLMCLAVYLLVLALRIRVPSARPASRTSRRHAGRHHRALHAAPEASSDPIMRKRMLLFAGSGVAAGLASDLAPGLWVLPLIVLGTLLVVRWQRPRWFYRSRGGLAALAVSLVVTALPGAWQYYLSAYISLPFLGSTVAHSGPGAVPAHHAALTLPAFIGQVARNADSVIHVLTAQDYSAGWPTSGGIPIIPGFIAWFLYGGIVLVLVRWRRFSSLILLLLLALPLVASIAVGTEPSVVEAAGVLPALCIVPALAIYQLAAWLGRLPIALDRAHGARVFANPESIGRLLLMAFLLFSTLRTFYWYFQATLPSTPPNGTIAS